MNSEDDLDMCLGNYNGHVGRHIDRFDRIQRRYRVGQKNLEGRMLLLLLRERIVCQIHSLRERKRGR